MDFRVKLGKQSRGGLYMDLLPGKYRGANSLDETRRVREDAFWFLEPAIKKHCPRYTWESHYG